MCVWLAACSPSHDYLGDRFPPTFDVGVYYPHETVPEGFVVIGTNRTEAGVDAEAEEIVEQVLVKAREVGAHAVAIESFSIEFAGTTRSRDVDVDDYGYREYTRVSDRRVKVMRTTFLRRAGE